MSSILQVVILGSLVQVGQGVLGPWRKDKDMTQEDFFDRMGQSLNRGADADQDQIILSRMARYAGSHGSRREMLPQEETFFPSTVLTSFIESDEKLKMAVPMRSSTAVKSHKANAAVKVGATHQQKQRDALARYGSTVPTTTRRANTKKANNKPAQNDVSKKAVRKSERVQKSPAPVEAAAQVESEEVITGKILLGNGTQTLYSAADDPYAGKKKICANWAMAPYPNKMPEGSVIPCDCVCASEVTAGVPWECCAGKYDGNYDFVFTSVWIWAFPIFFVLLIALGGLLLRMPALAHKSTLGKSFIDVKNGSSVPPEDQTGEASAQCKLEPAKQFTQAANAQLKKKRGWFRSKFSGRREPETI